MWEIKVGYFSVWIFLKNRKTWILIVIATMSLFYLMEICFISFILSVVFINEIIYLLIYLSYVLKYFLGFLIRHMKKYPLLNSNLEIVTLFFLEDRLFFLGFPFKILEPFKESLIFINILLINLSILIN